MHCRVQFLDREGLVLLELHAFAQSVTGAIELIDDADWPHDAVRLRILDADGRDVGGRER